MPSVLVPAYNLKRNPFKTPPDSPRSRKNGGTPSTITGSPYSVRSNPNNSNKESIISTTVVNSLKPIEPQLEYMINTEGGKRKTRRRKHVSKNKSKKARRNPKKISKRHLTRSTMSTRHRL